MKKVLFSLLLLSLISGSSYAADPFEKFTEQITGTGVSASIAEKNLDNFADDLGALMSGGTYHSGRSLGFPGFDVGIHVPAKKAKADDAIVKAAGIDTIFLPVLQLEVGLPYKFDLIGRYTSYADASLVGGGVRYGILRADMPGLPSLSVQAIYNRLAVNAGVNKFSAVSTSLSGMLSFNLPVIDPYIGATYVMSSVEPDAALPLPAPGLKGESNGYRLEGGVNIGLFPLTYLQIGASLVNGDIGYIAGLGVKY